MEFPKLHTEMFKCSACNSPAKMTCPTCIKLNLPPTLFCTQECFKLNWNSHKTKHIPQLSSYDPFTMYQYTGKMRAVYPLSEKRTIPSHIQKPDYAKDGLPRSEINKRGSTAIEQLSPAEIIKLKKVCVLGRQVLEEAKKAAKVGVTTDEIDRVVHEACIERDAYPSPLNYHNFPKSCCTSVNEVICHGIPDRYVLNNGDILNIDITVFHDSFHGDLNETILIGNVDDAGKKLVDTTRECLALAIQTVKPGGLYRDLGNVIQKHADNAGFSVVRTYCGHGIHKLFHCAPCIPHYAKNKAVGVMRPGHAFTIEPMISEGVWRDDTWPDNWTAVTQDGKRSAQFEQTLLVTETGYEILTL